jgi:peptidoglycan/xylan/chitin deacetylase (PgdA/CDA1 family)
MNAISSLVTALVLLTLSDGFFPISANGQFSQTSGKNKIIILTFDDGYNNQYTNTKPTLDKYEDKR